MLYQVFTCQRWVSNIRGTHPKKWHSNYCKSKCFWINDQNIVVVINNSKPAWPTKILMVSFWVSLTIYFKILTSFFKTGLFNFEILHKHAQFWFKVHFLLYEVRTCSFSLKLACGVVYLDLFNPPARKNRFTYFEFCCIRFLHVKREKVTV